MRYKIIVPGRPVVKKRPRLGRNNNIYTPRKTKEYEELVGWKAREVIKEPLKGNVAVYITIYGGSRIQGDLDNYAKSILDGMNKIAYEDDKQICSLSIQRISDKEERVEIEIEEVS
jgi:crossover junction endodeoxyribonuclease RusA